MYRSSSSGRVSDEFFSNSATSPPPAFSSPNLKLTSAGTPEELPMYNPQSHVAKKERNRLKAAENAVHLIPVVLVLSAIILWFFSSPEVQEGNTDDIFIKVLKHEAPIIRTTPKMIPIMLKKTILPLLMLNKVDAPVIYTKINNGSGKSSFTSKLELEGNDQTFQSKIRRTRNLPDRNSF